MDRWAKSLAIQSAWRNAGLDYEAKTTLHLSDGSTQGTVHARRLLCKKIVRKRASTVFTLADIDPSTLDRIFPFETLTVADWPNLFVDAVGKRVNQGVGQVLKVPLYLIDTDNATFWKYAGPKTVGGAGGLQTVYRGSQSLQGAIVSAAEYTTGTATAPSGYQVNTVTFTEEQIDFNGRPYVLEADWLLPGSRAAADELARILAAFGVAAGAGFAASAAYDNANGFAIDACYGGDGRTGRAIAADLCFAARAWATQTSTGAWDLTQDVPRVSSAQFDTSCDPIELDEYGDGDIPATVTLSYRPRASLAEDYSGSLSRSVGGAAAETQLHNPYIYAHAVADRLMSYWQARLKTLRVAKGTIYATQLASGARISVTDSVAYVGTKDFIATGIARPADANQVTLREYDANVYVYAPGTLPSDATNGYSPDYTFTDPEPPTNAAYVSGGTVTDQDGKLRAYALVHATPPAVNWSRLTAQIVDPATQEQHAAQLAFNGATGFYEATIGNLPLNRSLQLLVWATNSNNLDGFAAGPVSFTSATSAILPSNVASLSIGQTHSFQIDYLWPAVVPAPGDPEIDAYILEQQAGGGGSWVEIYRDKATGYSFVGATTGQQYTGRVRALNRAKNQSAASTTSAALVAQKMINDNHIASGGVGGGSISGGAINQGRTSTSTSSATGSVSNGFDAAITMGKYSFFPGMSCTAILPVQTIGSGITDDTGKFTIHNGSGASQTYNFIWRNFQP